MNFQVILFLFFFFSLCTSSIHDFFPLTEPLHQKSSNNLLLNKTSPYIQFLINSHKNNAHSVFSEVLDIEDILLTQLFFEVISYRDKNIFCVSLDGHPTLIACRIRRCIERTILNILFETCGSNMKFKENISLINILIEFLQRYSQVSYFSQETNVDPVEAFKSASKEVENLEYVIKCHFDESSNIVINYDFLSSLISWSKDYKKPMLPCCTDKQFASNCLLYYSYIHRIIDSKDFKFFEFEHHNRILPSIFILDNIDDSGTSLIDPEDSFFDSFYWDFEDFFCREKNLVISLEKIIERKCRIIAKAEGRVGSEADGSNWIFNLTDRFEKCINDNQSQYDQNILFQLKCLTIIEEFMNHTGHRVQRTEPYPNDEIFEKTNTTFHVEDEVFENFDINREEETSYDQDEEIFNKTIEDQSLNSIHYGRDVGVENFDIYNEVEETYDQDISVDDGSDSENDVASFYSDESNNDENDQDSDFSDHSAGSDY
jgi:hypothetical protein